VPPAVAVPAALERWPELAGRLAGKRAAVFLDYDGTLSPIVARPDLALLPEETRQVVARLAERLPVAILSGRLREDVSGLVGLPGLYYAGSHGFDIAGPAPAPGEPPLRWEAGHGIPELMARVAERLRRELAGIPGVLVEDKRFAVAVHYRQVDERDVPRVEAAVDRAAAEAWDGDGADGGEAGAETGGGAGAETGGVARSAEAGGAARGGKRLRKTGGKKVWELRPDVDWNKGRALLWLLERIGRRGGDGEGEGRGSAGGAGDRADGRNEIGGTPGRLLPIFIGDDVTDEDAFRAAASRGGIGILVAEEPRATAASYRLRDPGEALELLRRLAELPQAAPAPAAEAAGRGTRER
jgi:trehalose-6-phosphatase